MSMMDKDLIVGSLRECLYQTKAVDMEAFKEYLFNFFTPEEVEYIISQRGRIMMNEDKYEKALNMMACKIVDFSKEKDCTGCPLKGSGIEKWGSSCKQKIVNYYKREAGLSDSVHEKDCELAKLIKELERGNN